MLEESRKSDNKYEIILIKLFSGTLIAFTREIPLFWK